MLMRCRNACLLIPTPGSDGSKIQDPVSKIETAGAGAYCKIWGDAWNCRSCGQVEFLTNDDALKDAAGGFFLLSLDRVKQPRGPGCGGLSFLFKPFFFLCTLALTTYMSSILLQSS